MITASRRSKANNATHTRKQTDAKAMFYTVSYSTLDINTILSLHLCSELWVEVRVGRLDDIGTLLSNHIDAVLDSAVRNDLRLFISIQNEPFRRTSDSQE